MDQLPTGATEISGVPFGVPNDVLMHMSVNNRRGMTYGMTHRGFVTMWKLWDEFGIADSDMHGYWEDDPVITLDQEEVYATSFIKEGKVLVAIGNWRSEPVNVKMNIDWKRLKMNPKEVTIIAPEMKDYQEDRSFKVGESIPVGSKSDCLLIISKK